MSLKSAINDVFQGARNHEFWVTFGANDIQAKYRRSKLGEWWITLSVAVFIFVIGGLYRGIFDAHSTYMAYLAVGYILWQMISTCVNQGASVFTQAKPFMLQKAWPESTFVYRVIYREILVLAHNFVLIPPIFIYLKLWPGFIGIGLSLLGLAFTILTAFWVVLFLGIIGLRYRDVPPIVQSLMRMAFFATPIIWIDRNMGTFGEWVLLLNPFGYFLKIVRDPLLSGSVDPMVWAIAIGIGFAMMLTALITLALTKNKLSYWL